MRAQFLFGTAMALLGALHHPASAQVIMGSFAKDVPLPSMVKLAVAWGGEMKPIDSVAVDPKGRFLFPKRSYPAGFYQLAIDQNDRLDLVLEPREPVVDLRFKGLPMQEHVEVIASRENQRLWAYKLASRRAQLRLAENANLRAQAAGKDLQRLDSMDHQAREDKRQTLELLLAEDPTSFFAFVVRTDRDLERAAEAGPAAMAAAMPWSDQRLVRSSVYPKAVLSLLRSVPFDQPGGLRAASDSILSWAAPDSVCWTFARELLVRIFDQMGPEDMVQYLVDRYVMGPNALHPPDATLRRICDSRLAWAVGASIPTLRVRDPERQDSVDVNALVARHAYTLLFYYGSTCEHCHAEIPGLSAIRETYREKGFEVLGIALDADLEDYVGMRKAMGIRWPGGSDLMGWGSPAAKALGIKATPSLVLVDGAGTIVAKPYDHIELAEFLGTHLP
jgi:peroxiredoxin